MFEKVQLVLADNRMRQLSSVGAKSPCLLTGKLFDDRGNYMSINQQKFLLEQASCLSFNDADDERLFYHSLISRIVLSDHDITIILAGEVLVPLLRGKYWIEAHSVPHLASPQSQTRCRQ